METFNYRIDIYPMKDESGDWHKWALFNGNRFVADGWQVSLRDARWDAAKHLSMNLVNND